MNQELSERLEALQRQSEAGLNEAFKRISEDTVKLRAEAQQLAERAVNTADEARGFLEEVVRAEIRGRMQGQQQLLEQIQSLEEVCMYVSM